MTTWDHTLLATATAVMTQDVPNPWWKALVVVALILTHPFPFDAFPHPHLWDYKKMLKTLPGAVIEVGGGLFLLPYFLSLATGCNVWWVYLCAVAASMFDGLVMVEVILGILLKRKFNFITAINHTAHYWDDPPVDSVEKWAFGSVTTVFFVTLLLAVATDQI